MINALTRTVSRDSTTQRDVTRMVTVLKTVVR
jgi:hypothetical protein